MPLIRQIGHEMRSAGRIGAFDKEPTRDRAVPDTAIIGLPAQHGGGSVRTGS